MRQRYDEQEVTVFGLNAGNDSAADLNAFVNAFQVSYPILLNANSVYGLYVQGGATSPFPLDYVIDQQGRVAYFSTEYDPETMIEVIDSLLGQTSFQPDLPTQRPLLLQAAPNPFNPRVEISFYLNRSQPVSLDILDARGHQVRTLLASEWRPEGPVEVHWDGRDNQGRNLPSGLFLARIRTLEQSNTVKLTLVR